MDESKRTQTRSLNVVGYTLSTMRMAILVICIGAGALILLAGVALTFLSLLPSPSARRFLLSLRTRRSSKS